MTTTQHPLTDEMIDPRIAENRTDDEDARYWFDKGREYERESIPLADPHHDPRPWQDCTREDIRKGDLVETLVGGLVSVGVAHHQDEDGDWCTKGGFLLTSGTIWPLRRIPATTEKETPMTETAPAVSSEPLARTLLGVPEGHGAPHHDADQIRPGDFVVQVYESVFIRAGIAHHRDGDGDWRAENGQLLTWAAKRVDRPDALTVWPAPTPPAEEVELPTRHPAHITDVENTDGQVSDYMALNKYGHWVGVMRDGYARELGPRAIIAFTLPDGTRARRDGERPDGEPRFVKTQEEA